MKKNPKDDNLKKELLDLEKQYWTALKEQDSDVVLRLSDDTTILTGPSGVHALEKEEIVGMMEQATYQLQDFKLKDVEVQRVGEDTAVIAYKVHEDLVVDGAPVSLDAADASTWVRKNGSWVCSMHTESILGDPFGRDRGKRVDAPN